MIVTVHWILTFLIIAFLIASGLKPKNFFLINLMLFIMVLRCYLPFFDFEERREIERVRKTNPEKAEKMQEDLEKKIIFDSKSR